MRNLHQGRLCSVFWPVGFHIVSRQQTSHVFLGLRPKFLRPAYSKRWNVSHAPKQGLCPNGKIQSDCPGSPFSKCAQGLCINVWVIYTSTGGSQHSLLGDYVLMLFPCLLGLSPAFYAAIFTDC